LRSLFSLEGKVVLVTGSTRGLGWTMAQALASAGAHVLINSRKAEEVEARTRTLNAQGLAASPAAFNIADERVAVGAMSHLIQLHGRLDVLVNNAGIVHRGKFLEVSGESWREVLETDLTAAFLLAREAARHMAARGSGRIVNVASIMSRLARWGAPAYVTAKHGLIGLTRAIAVEFGRKGVTCNAIAPGFFRTELNVSQQQNGKLDEQVRSRTPLCRWGEPPELAGVAVFLASDASSYVSGATIYVDGGLTAAF
jgi:gluconate 5-dehydrogenase